MLDDLRSGSQLLTEALHPRDKFLSLSGTKATDELQDRVHVVVLASQVDINTNLVDHLDVHLFEALSKARLVDVLLHRVQIESQGLVLGCNGAPKVENLS